jgi:hypothetical protein
MEDAAAIVVAAAGGRCLFLDDAHWCDPLSVAVGLEVADRLPVIVVVATGTEGGDGLAHQLARSASEVVVLGSLATMTPQRLLAPRTRT